MFQKILVANRGAIARRVIRSLRQMGIRSVAVYSEADKDLPYLAEADETYAIGADEKGVLITDVDKGSDAEKQGLIKGLVISEVNQQKVTTVAEVMDKVGAAKEAGRPAVLFKVRDPAGTSRFVAVRLN